MSFFDQQLPAPRQISGRVAAWNNQAVYTHENPDYKAKARQGQDAMSKSFIVGGKIVKAIHAEPRSNLPSNVHGFSNNDSSTKPARAPLDARSGGRAGGQYYPSQSARAATGPTDFAKGAPSGLHDQPSSSSKGPQGQPTPSGTGPGVEGKTLGLPPHLRHRGTATSATPVKTPVEEPTGSLTKLSKHGTRAPPTMNAGTAAKSAKLASNFPCTFPDCTRGFSKEKAMKSHKQEEHHYCRFCDEDFLEFDDLHYHKIDSDEHICCAVCGEDFRSEAGRDTHERQSHMAQQECKCVGCGLIFQKGASLIYHIYSNQCKSDRIPKLVNQDTFMQQRAHAALHLDAIDYLNKDTAKQIEAMQAQEDDASSTGGVRLEPRHLLDNHDPMEGAGLRAIRKSASSGSEDDDLIDLSETGIKSSDRKAYGEFPPISETTSVKGKQKHQSVVEGMDALTVKDEKAIDYAKVLFAGVSANAEAGQGTGVTMIDYRQAVLSGGGGPPRMVPTEWDHTMFARHPVDGHFHCPFINCRESYVEIDVLKRHLTSGYHQGTNTQCQKCLKRFKHIPALVAHLESNSERCKVKDSDQYGQMLAVVSGGFLGVKGRSADGSLKIGALNEEELAEQAEDQRQAFAACEAIDGDR